MRVSPEDMLSLCPTKRRDAYSHYSLSPREPTFSVSNRTTFETGTWARDVAQWYSKCLAYARSPVLQVKRCRGRKRLLQGQGATSLQRRYVIGSARVELSRSPHSNPSMGSFFKFPQRTPFSSMTVFLSPSVEDRVIS